MSFDRLIEEMREPKFKVGDKVLVDLDDGLETVIEVVEVNEKYLSDYGIAVWVYSNDSDERRWWAHEDEITLR